MEEIVMRHPSATFTETKAVMMGYRRAASNAQQQTTVTATNDCDNRQSTSLVATAHRQPVPCWGEWQIREPCSSIILTEVAGGDNKMENMVTRSSKRFSLAQLNFSCCVQTAIGSKNMNLLNALATESMSERFRLSVCGRQAKGLAGGTARRGVLPSVQVGGQQLHQTKSRSGMPRSAKPSGQSLVNSGAG